MGVFTTGYKNKTLDHMVGVSANASPTLYLGLSTTTPTATGTNVTEPSGNGYARVEVTSNLGAASSGAVTSTSAVSFPESSGSWGTVTHAVLFDAASTGNVVGWDALTESRVIGSNVTVTFNAGELDFSLGDA